MPKNWHHFSAKEHADFLSERGFGFKHSKGSHFFYVRMEGGRAYVVQVVKGDEERRQSRKTMDMSARHSGIPKAKYKEWINQR